MPFGSDCQFRDFDHCVSVMQRRDDVDDPEAVCGAIKRDTESMCSAEQAQPAIMQAGQRALVLNVEVFSAGMHTDSQGNTREFTGADLDTLAQSFRLAIPERVAIKLGHSTPEHNAEIAQVLGVPAAVLTGDEEDANGQAALGTVVGLARNGDKLLADFETMPEIARMIQRGMFGDVSSEILKDFNGQSLAMSAVALLGAERPAIKDLAGLPGWQTGQTGMSALSLTAPEQAMVYTFAMPDEVDDVDDETMTALEEAARTIEAQIKGKRGAKTIRTFIAELKRKIRDLSASQAGRQAGRQAGMSAQRNREARGIQFADDLPGAQHFQDDPARICGNLWFNGTDAQRGAFGNGTEGQSRDVRPPKAWWDDCIDTISGSFAEEEHDMDTSTLAQALDLASDATQEQITERIQSLIGTEASHIQLTQQLAEATGEQAGEGAEALLARAKERIAEAQRASYSESQLAQKVSALERQNRVAHYKEQTSALNAVEGNPDKLAEELVSLEESAGKEAAERHLAMLQQMQRYAEQAGATQAIGAGGAGAGNEDRHPVELEMEEWLKEQNLPVNAQTLPKAYAHFATHRKDRFAELNRDRKVYRGAPK